MQKGEQESENEGGERIRRRGKDEKRFWEFVIGADGGGGFGGLPADAFRRAITWVQGLPESI